MTMPLQKTSERRHSSLFTRRRENFPSIHAVSRFCFTRFASFHLFYTLPLVSGCRLGLPHTHPRLTHVPRCTGHSIIPTDLAAVDAAAIVRYTGIVAPVQASGTRPTGRASTAAAAFLLP